MNRFIDLSQINPIKRVLSSIKIATRQRFSLAKHLRFISKQESLYNQFQQANKYSDQLSYQYRLFQFNNPHCLHQFSFYSDQDIGGDSNGQILFDKQENCLIIEGVLSDKNKEKLIQFPSIGMARSNDYSIHCGPFNALSIQINSDGQPIHLGAEVKSRINGTVQCYGVITSKVKGWRTYELPFVNMILVGAQQHQQWNNGQRELLSLTNKDGTNLGIDRLDMRRIIQTQTDEVVMKDINLRLLSSKSVPRRVAIRNINLVRRSQSQRFIKDYLHPYFYIVEEDPYIVQKQIGVSWLSKGYQHLKTIDLGDKKYIKKQQQGRKH